MSQRAGSSDALKVKNATGESDPRQRPIAFRGSGGVALRGDAWGSPADAPVLLLHGGGQTRHAWGGTAVEIARRGWYAISIDQRGHGDSDWAPDGAYDFQAFADDVTAVVESLARAPVLVGASLGGLAALIAEAQTTAPFSKALVLVDIAPRMERTGIERIHGFMTANPDGFETLEDAADAVASYLPQRRRPKDLSGLAKNLRRGDDGRYRWHWDPRFLGTVSKRRRSSGIPATLEGFARSLTVPTLLVRGRMSDLLSEQGAREFLGFVPHARFVDVSGAGHMVAGDRNDAFTRAVVDFLRQTLP